MGGGVRSLSGLKAAWTASCLVAVLGKTNQKQNVKKKRDLAERTRQEAEGKTRTQNKCGLLIFV